MIDNGKLAKKVNDKATEHLNKTDFIVNFSFGVSRSGFLATIEKGSSTFSISFCRDGFTRREQTRKLMTNVTPVLVSRLKNCNRIGNKSLYEKYQIIKRLKKNPTATRR